MAIVKHTTPNNPGGAHKKMAALGKDDIVEIHVSKDAHTNENGGFGKVLLRYFHRCAAQDNRSSEGVYSQGVYSSLSSLSKNQPKTFIHARGYIVRGYIVRGYMVRGYIY